VRAALRRGIEHGRIPKDLPQPSDKALQLLLAGKTLRCAKQWTARESQVQQAPIRLKNTQFVHDREALARRTTHMTGCPRRREICARWATELRAGGVGVGIRQDGIRHLHLRSIYAGTTHGAFARCGNDYSWIVRVHLQRGSVHAGVCDRQGFR
jgi:hypothetical protein